MTHTPFEAVTRLAQFRMTPASLNLSCGSDVPDAQAAADLAAAAWRKRNGGEPGTVQVFAQAVKTYMVVVNPAVN